MYDSKFYDTATVKVVDNEALQVLLENQIETKLDLMQFAHADYTLTEGPGMVKKIRTYHGVGKGEELAMGQGNTEIVGSFWDEVEYRVGTYQMMGEYFDEQLMADPTAIDKMIKYMAEENVNDNYRKVIAEMNKSHNRLYDLNWNFDSISDAIASFPDERTEDEAVFLLINRKDSSAWRKTLKDQLKYVEAFVRKGYIGTVCGVPVYWSDLVPEGKAFLGTKNAVEVMIKKGIETEQERDANCRKNTVFARKVQLVALVEPNEMFVLSTATDPTTGKTKLMAEPADWETNYTNYFMIDVETDTLINVPAGTEAPLFVVGKYFA